MDPNPVRFHNRFMDSVEDRDMKIAFGKRLRALRIAAGFPVQRRFAEALGHEASSKLNQWEKGGKQPDMTEIGKIVRLTNASVDWLFFGNPALMPYGLMREIEAVLEADRTKTE